MYYIVKYTAQMVSNRFSFTIECDWSLNFHFLMKSAFLDPHFHMLFMLEIYSQIRRGYKTKYVQYIKIIKAKSFPFMRICVLFNTNQVIGLICMSFELRDFEPNSLYLPTFCKQINHCLS